MTEKICENCVFYVIREDAPSWETGKCAQLRLYMHIEIKAGWNGGYVEYIEPDRDFGCNKWCEKREEK